MNRPDPSVKAVRATGILLVVLALLLNERTLATTLTPDGVLASGSAWAVRAFELVLLVSGLASLGWAPASAMRLARLNPFREGGVALPVILIAGAVLRVVVFIYLRPNNNDPHQEFIDFVVRERRLPIASEVLLGFQPPLYYLLAAPWAYFGSPKVIQFFSLLLSLGHLFLLKNWIERTKLLATHRARCHALFLCAFLPQFVLFGLFVSNDALAFPLGTLVVLVAIRTLERPSRGNIALLGVVQGLALLTKGTLIGSVLVLIGVLVLSAVHRRLAIRKLAAELALFGVCTALVGGYKFAENQVHFGTPVVSNDVLKQPWVERQTGTYRGLASWLDLDVSALVRRPFLTETVLREREREPVLHSLPLLFYGTFWYSYILESDFDATRAYPFHLVPRAIYLIALPATALILLGGAAVAARLARLREWCFGEEDVFRRRSSELVVFGVLALNVALVVRWALQHDAWSFFQSRLFFSSFLSIALFYAWGLEALERRLPTVRALFGFALAGLYVCLAAYWIVELGAQLSA